MCRLEYPVGVLGVGDCVVIPFDLEVAWGLFEERRAGEGVHV